MRVPALRLRPRRWRPRLRTILVSINLVILLLPLGGIFVLRIYESALVRQTESELLGQGAFVAAAYEGLFEHLQARGETQPHAPAPEDYGLPSKVPPENPAEPHGRSPQLDLAADTIYPDPPDPQYVAAKADSLAQEAGRELTPVLRNTQGHTLAGIRVVDYQGLIVASTGDDIGQSLLAFEEVKRALRGETVSLLRRRASEASPLFDTIMRGARIRVSVALPVVRGDRVLGAVLVARTPANLRQAMTGKWRALLQGAVLLLMVVLTLSLFTSVTINRPVHALMEQARRAARGERGAVTPLKRAGTREIAELSETVAAMAQTLESRAAYIRDFATHVSHEFKTPLTAIQGAVELLSEHDTTMSGEERQRFLRILGADAARLERLVRRLLELARADVLQPGRLPSGLNPVLGACAQRYREQGTQVLLRLDRACEQASVAMAPEVLDSILSQLVDNARQHGGPGVEVSLDGTLDASGSNAIIVLADNGPGISTGNASKVFEPFFTTARGSGGTGLGLAIIRSLLSAHGGSIGLLERPAGAAFRIVLPVAEIPD